MLTAKSIKAIVVLDAAALLDITVVNGSGPVPFVITAGEQTLKGQFNAKTLRRAATASRNSATTAVRGRSCVGESRVGAAAAVAAAAFCAARRAASAGLSQPGASAATSAPSRLRTNHRNKPAYLPAPAPCPSCQTAARSSAPTGCLA
jgi:hypothetical protein